MDVMCQSYFQKNGGIIFSWTKKNGRNFFNKGGEFIIFLGKKEVVLLGKFIYMVMRRGWLGCNCRNSTKKKETLISFCVNQFFKILAMSNTHIKIQGSVLNNEHCYFFKVIYALFKKTLKMRKI